MSIGVTNCHTKIDAIKCCVCVYIYFCFDIYTHTHRHACGIRESVCVRETVVVALFSHSQKLLIISSPFSAPHIQLNRTNVVLLNDGVVFFSRRRSLLLLPSFRFLYHNGYIDVLICVSIH